MKFTKPIEVKEFFRVVNECEGEVWLESPRGDKFVLKSIFSHYIAMSKLLAEKGDELELYCQLPRDEGRFLNFFCQYPETV